jgi:hypothetical protein
MSKNLFAPLSEEVRNELSARIRGYNRTERVKERACWVIHRPVVFSIPAVTFNGYEIALSFVIGDCKLEITCSPFDYKAVATLGRQNTYVYANIKGYDLDSVIENFFTFIKENQNLMKGVMRAPAEKTEPIIVSTNQ